MPAPRPVLPAGPRYPRIVQALLWLKQPTRLLEHCARRYGDVFTLRLPLGTDLVQISSPELVRTVFRSAGAAVAEAADTAARALRTALRRRVHPAATARHGPGPDQQPGTGEDSLPICRRCCG